MRHAIGLFRGLDKEFAHTPDVVSCYVVSLRTHQFCRVDIHTVTLLTAPDPFERHPVRTHPGNKKPAHRRTSAAGKYLTQMDLPLAASEPSPPDRSRCGLRLARHHLDTPRIKQFQVPTLPGPTRARFEFAARTHREEITPFMTKLQSQLL